VFSTGGSIEEVFLASHYGKPGDHLNVRRLFANGAYSMRISSLPGTNDKIHAEWRVIVSKFMVPPPRNKAISSKFGREWFGNVVMVKYSLGKDCSKLRSISSADRELAFLILHR